MQGDPDCAVTVLGATANEMHHSIYLRHEKSSPRSPAGPPQSSTGDFALLFLIRTNTDRLDLVVEVDLLSI